MKKNINKLIADFNCFEEWQEKYTYIIELGKELAVLDKNLKVPANIVEGCSSQVWLHYCQKNGLFFFAADSDAHIVKGLLYIVIMISNGKTKEEIMGLNFEKIFSELQLVKHLTPIRSNGLIAVVKRIKSLVRES